MRVPSAIRIASVVLAMLLVGIGGWFAAQHYLQQALAAAGPHSVTVSVHVAPGEGLRAVLNDLAQKGALRNVRTVELALRITQRKPVIRAGNYEIPPLASPQQILQQLMAGRVVLESLTVIEGSRFEDLRRALEQHPHVTHTLRGLSDAQVMTAIGHDGEHAEGRFFPDTYRFAADTRDRDLLRLAYRQMSELLARSWPERAPDLLLHSAYEALVLASIVEKETGQARERARIAGVFIARLRRGMRLQSDPTVIYGLGDAYDGNIRSRDLQTDNPYNTYTRDGLPPTPISLPGRASLLAVLHPLEDGSLFFVADGSGDGSHVFSKDYAAHQAAVQRMLREQRARGLIH